MNATSERQLISPWAEIQMLVHAHSIATGIHKNRLSRILDDSLTLFEAKVKSALNMLEEEGKQ